MKYFMLIIGLLFFSCTNAQKNAGQALDTLHHMVFQLGRIVLYTREAPHYSGAWLDSIVNTKPYLGERIRDCWLLLKTRDSKILDSIMQIKDSFLMRQQLLRWKYAENDFELSDLLKHYEEILRATVTIIMQKQDNQLRGEKIEYEEMAFVAENNFMLFQEKLNAIIERHHNFSGKQKK